MNTSSKLLAPLAATAVLLLSVCGGSLENPTSAPATGTTSSSASSAPATTSAAATTAAATTAPAETTEPAETSAPETTEAEPTVEPTTAEPTPEQTSAPAETAQAADTAVEAPGTNCGSSANSQDVCVSGGPVSCAEAVSVINTYNDPNTPHDNGIGLKADFNGYECYADRSMMGLSGMIADRSVLCTNTAGAYIEARTPGLRIIPGPVDEVGKYLDNGASATVRFASPGRGTYCYGTWDDKNINCMSSNGKKDANGAIGMTTVTISAHGAPKITENFTYFPYESVEMFKTVNAGTTLTSLGVSCQPQDDSTMRCVNPDGGFTLSPSGVTTE